jgi:GalNAc-alpha-(1->4)-GalNAc-alpha-(1->3)-diNAcBac-PP-undecaprenol alpha-1,4-N-acetyl-D-galactosaminyltransferase
MSVHNGKKRICFVIPSLHAGGMERVMSELIAYLCSRTQHELHLILYGRHREIFYDLPDGIKVHKPSFRFNDDLRIWSSLRTMIFLR